VISKPLMSRKSRKDVEQTYGHFTCISVGSEPVYLLSNADVHFRARCILWKALEGLPNSS